MANIGRNQNKILYDKTGYYYPSTAVSNVSATSITPVVYEVVKDTDENGNSVLSFKSTDKETITALISEQSALPISVNEMGQILIDGNVVVNGNIETSTDTHQITGDVHATIIEDIDGGTF